MKARHWNLRTFVRADLARQVQSDKALRIARLLRKAGFYSARAEHGCVFLTEADFPMLEALAADLEVDDG